MAMARKSSGRWPSAGAQVKVLYADGTKKSFRLNLPGGDNTWTPHALNFNATKPYTKIEVRFMYSRGSGTVWFDNVMLLQNQANFQSCAMLPLTLHSGSRQGHNLHMRL
jgi:hypothetical protein